MGGSEFKVTRTRATCSGIKCCSCSVEKNAIPHEGYQEGNQPVIPSLVRDGGDGFTEELRKAREVFFYCQAKFPITCKHAGSIVGSDDNRESRYLRQSRCPNWTLKSGFMMHDPDNVAPPIRMPDIADCASFGKDGLTERRDCDFIIIPDNLQGANVMMVNNYVRLASEGLFPEQPRTVIDRCPPLPMTFGGTDCHQALHGHEAVPISVIPCSVRYHYLIHHSDGIPIWAVIIGYGKHSHALPFKRPSPEQTKQSVKKIMTSNNTATVHEICDFIVSVHGTRPSMASIRKQKNNFRMTQHPNGRDLNSVKAALRNRRHLQMKMYLQDVIDERLQDETRLTRDQVGVVILMWDEDLLRRSLSNPTFGCDGTFSVVSKSADNVDLELVSIICQDPGTRRMFSPMRMLASRKTTACRKLMFDRFFRELKNLGLPDPLTAPPHQCLTISTDFETTFAISLGQSLTEIYRPEHDPADFSHVYIEKVCFGCGVHAHRIVQEKINKRLQGSMYRWMISSRLYETENDVRHAITYMKTINKKVATFAKWLEQNYVARVLWFWRRYKSLPSSVQRRVMWTTNASESHHALLKGSRHYIMTRSKGMDVISFITFLEALDTKEEQNLSGNLGVPHTSTPVLNRYGKGLEVVHILW